MNPSLKSNKRLNWLNIAAVELLRSIIGRSSVSIGHGPTAAPAVAALQPGHSVALPALQSLVVHLLAASVVAAARQAATARRPRSRSAHLGPRGRPHLPALVRARVRPPRPRSRQISNER